MSVILTIGLDTSLWLLCFLFINTCAYPQQEPCALGYHRHGRWIPKNITTKSFICCAEDNPHNPDHTEAQLRREQSALAQTAPSGIFCIFSVCCMQARGRTKTETEGPSQMTKQEALGHLAGERAVMYTTDTGNIVPEPSVGLTRVPFSNTVVRRFVRVRVRIIALRNPDSNGPPGKYTVCQLQYTVRPENMRCAHV